MDQRELHLQPLGICYRIYNFIMKTLVSQALKTVTLGRPMHLGSNRVHTNSSSSCKEREVVTKEEGEEQKENPKKAPKKMVSINENVEEIFSSKKKKRSKSFKKSKSLEQQQEEEEKEEIKPLRSILKVKSNLDEKSMPGC